MNQKGSINITNSRTHTVQPIHMPLRNIFFREIGYVTTGTKPLIGFEHVELLFPMRQPKQFNSSEGNSKPK